jgi:hypothetical protein
MEKLPVGMKVEIDEETGQILLKDGDVAKVVIDHSRVGVPLTTGEKEAIGKVVRASIDKFQDNRDQGR